MTLLAAIPNSPPAHVPCNIPASLLSTAKLLKQSRPFVVRDSDKGLGPCIISYDWYFASIKTHVDDIKTYTRISDDVNPATVLEDWKARVYNVLCALGCSPSHARTILEPTSFPSIYVLPKLHKISLETPFASRPIVTLCSSPTTPISDILVTLLTPIMLSDTWTLRSSYDVINWIENNTSTIPPSASLLTFDVVSLYPSMNIDDTIACVVKQFCAFYHLPITCYAAVTLSSLLNLVMKDNFFQCHTSASSVKPAIYTQIDGITMGLSCAVVLANIFVGHLFAPIFDRYNNRTDTTVFLRRGFVDDGLCIIHTPPSVLTELLIDLNNASPYIKITHTVSLSQVIFLDMVIEKGPRWHHTHCKLDTRVYSKPLNKHLFIPFSSAHSSLASFISGEARRFVCLSTSEDDALLSSLQFQQQLLARGYPIQVIVEQLACIHYSRRHHYLRAKDFKPVKQKPNIVNTPATCPFVLPFIPQIATLGVGKHVHKHLAVFPHLKPVMAWRAAPKLQSFLGLQWP
jgi:hypothetical protein